MAQLFFFFFISTCVNNFHQFLYLQYSMLHAHTNIFLQWPLQLLLHTSCELASRHLLMLSHTAWLQRWACACTNTIWVSSSTTFHLLLPSFRLTFSHPPPFPTVAPFSPIKEEQLYNNSRRDSQTLTLHIMELEVLGKPLMWESQVWTLSASLRNTMVLKPNKVCWWWWKVRNLPPEYRADKSVWTTVGMGATREEIN